MKAVKPALTTPRLILKQQSLHDFDRYYAMSVDARVMKYIGDGSVYHWTPDVARDKFRQQIRRHPAEGLGVLAIYRRHHPLYLGWCAVAPSRFLDGIELGYRLCSDAWGRGYATEASGAMLSQAFGRMGLDRIEACTHPRNLASIRVLEKLGFSPTHFKLSRPIRQKIPVYTLDRQTYMARNASDI